MSHTQEDELKAVLTKDFNKLLVKEFTSDWKIQRLKIGLDIDVMSLDNLLAYLDKKVLEELRQIKSCETYACQDVYIENRITELKAKQTKEES